MIVMPKSRAAFVEIPRTASQAMKKFFREQLGGKVVPAKRQHFCRLPRACRGYKIMCGVRNPYARAYSHYIRRLMRESLSQRQLSFEEFLDTARGERSIQHYLRVAGVLRADILIRFEGLPRSFRQAVRKIAPKAVPRLLPHVGMRTGHGWQGFFTQARADLVWRMSKGDFKKYDYDRDSWRQG